MNELYREQSTNLCRLLSKNNENKWKLINKRLTLIFFFFFFSTQNVKSEKLYFFSLPKMVKVKTKTKR